MLEIFAFEAKMASGEGYSTLSISACLRISL